MERIIAGRFPTKSEADAAAAQLAPFVEATDICIFHNNPPGQHDAFPVGGDEDEDPGARNADSTAAGTAGAGAVAGGMIGALAGPAGAIAGAAVGAYSGSLMGAMGGLGEDATPGVPDRRAGGIMIAVRISAPANEDRVIDTLRAQGAADIERAEGTWKDGDWVDFDPVAAPRLVAQQASTRG